MKTVVRLLCALALLLPVACSQHQDSPTLRIGALYPLNGTQGPGGDEEFHGVETAVRLVNADGGIAGRQARLDTVDVPSAGLAVAGIQRLADAGVNVVLGSYGSTISAPAARAAQARGLVFWETGAVGDIMAPGQGQRIYRFPPTGEVLGVKAIDFITDRFAPRRHVSRHSLRFAVIGVSDTYGRAVMAGALAELASRGLHPVVDVRYNPLHYDREAIIRRVAAAKPDVTFAAAYLDDAVALRREMVRQHLRLIAGIGTSSSYCHLEFGTQLGPDAVGLFASDKPDAAALNPTGLLPDARKLLARADADYRSHYRASMTAAALTGFSGAWALLHDVLPRAGSDDPGAVARAAHQVRIPVGGLPNGSGLAFGPPGAPNAGANLRAASVIWEWVAPGKRVVIWPQRFATQPLQMLQVAG